MPALALMPGGNKSARLRRPPSPPPSAPPCSSPQLRQSSANGAISSTRRVRDRIAAIGCGSTWNAAARPSRSSNSSRIPSFRNLSPEKQNQLLDRLRNFNSQPPEKKAQDPEPDGNLRAHDSGAAGQRRATCSSVTAICRMTRGPRFRKPTGACAVCRPRRATNC